jgi:hypothetical protein
MRVLLPGARASCRTHSARLGRVARRPISRCVHIARSAFRRFCLVGTGRSYDVEHRGVYMRVCFLVKCRCGTKIVTTLGCFALHANVEHRVCFLLRCVCVGSMHPPTGSHDMRHGRAITRDTLRGCDGHMHATVQVRV